MKCNPAQDASRGITAKELVESSRWIIGPEFLWMPEDRWPQPLEDQELVSLPDNPEVKKVTSYATSTQESWACRAIAICLRYKEKLWQLVFPKKERCAKMVKRHQRPARTVKRFVSQKGDPQSSPGGRIFKGNGNVKAFSRRSR